MAERSDRYAFDFPGKLLRLLESLPGGAATRQNLYRSFEQQYGQTMPDGFRRTNSQGWITWQYYLSWEMTRCKQLGLLNQPSRGLWRLTESGRQYLVDAEADAHPRPSQSPVRRSKPDGMAAAEPAVGTPRQRLDYKLKLFTLLSQLAGHAATTGDIKSLFEEQYGAEMPQHYFERSSTGSIRWEHSLAGQMSLAKRKGLLDQPRPALWRLTAAGMRWLERREVASSDASEHLPVRRRKGREPYNSSPKGRRQRFNYKLKVFKLLHGQPERTATTTEITRLFGNQFGAEIPREAWEQDHGGFVRWKHNLAGQLTASKRERLLDQPTRGVWRLTEAGVQWLAAQSQPNGDVITTITPLSIDTPGQAGFRAGTNGPTTRTARPVATAQAHAILDDKTGHIVGFLSGQTEYRPSDETLCDWLMFCYWFGLFREGRDLWPLISPGGVAPEHYERMRRIARVCQLNASRYE